MNDIIQLFNLKDDDFEEFNCSTNHENKSKTIHLTLKRKDTKCPYCGLINIYIDRYNHRLIKHPILQGLNCYIDYWCRRFRCCSCKSTYNELNPFVDSKNKCTKFTKLLVLQKLKNPRLTFSDVAKECNLSTTHVINIFDSLGRIKRLSLPEVLCIDGIHDPCSGIGKFDCVFMDFASGNIVDVLPDRTQNYLHHYFQNFKKDDLSRVKHISIDMWLPYKQIAQIYFRNASISIDSFHVMEHISSALKSVKNKVKNSLIEKSNEKYLLTKFDYLLSKNYNDIKYFEPKLNRKLKLYLNAHSTLDLLLKIDPSLELAYNLKELYHRFNRDCNQTDAETHLRDIINTFFQSGIDEFTKLAKMLETWFNEIVNSFKIHNDRRISNGPIESLNRRLRIITSNSYGMNNFTRERNRFMYCFNVDKYLVFENFSIKRHMKKRGEYNK